MTTIAQLDLNQDPAVVLFLYHYGDDPVPEQMVPPEYVDVSAVDPLPAPGYTYDGERWRPGEPQKRERTREVLANTAEDWVAGNSAYLEIASPTADDMAAQIASLTAQMTYTHQLNLEQHGREQDFAPYVPSIGGGPVLPDEPPPEEKPPEPSTGPPPHVDEEPVELTAAFTYTPAQPTAKGPVQFDATASTGAVKRYDWNFGDEAKSRAASSGGLGPTPSHTYARKGTYTVTLTLTDEDGDMVYTDDDVTIT